MVAKAGVYTEWFKKVRPICHSSFIFIKKYFVCCGATLWTAKKLIFFLMHFQDYTWLIYCKLVTERSQSSFLPTLRDVTAPFWDFFCSIWRRVCPRYGSSLEDFWREIELCRQHLHAIGRFYIQVLEKMFYINSWHEVQVTDFPANGFKNLHSQTNRECFSKFWPMQSSCFAYVAVQRSKHCQASLYMLFCYFPSPWSGHILLDYLNTLKNFFYQSKLLVVFEFQFCFSWLIHILLLEHC